MLVAEANTRVESKVRLGELESPLHQPTVPTDQMVDVVSILDNNTCQFLIGLGAN